MKKTMDLNKLGLQEMSLKETQIVEGGFWGLIFTAAQIIYDIYTTSDKDFQSGVSTGRNIAGGDTKKP